MKRKERECSGMPTMQEQFDHGWRIKLHFQIELCWPLSEPGYFSGGLYLFSSNPIIYSYVLYSALGIPLQHAGMVPKCLRGNDFEGKKKKKEIRAPKCGSSLSAVYENYDELSSEVPELARFGIDELVGEGSILLLAGKLKATSSDIFVGEVVKKSFGQHLFTGTITRRLTCKGSSRDWWKVLYEDGDEEDMTKTEVMAHLVDKHLVDKPSERKPAPPLSRTAVPNKSTLRNQPVNFCLFKGGYSFNVSTMLSNSFLNQKAQVTLSDKICAAGSEGPVLLYAHFTLDYFSLHEAARCDRRSLYCHISAT
jgi:hypothetical protein